MREYKAALRLRSTHLPAIHGIGTLQEATAAQVDHISAYEMSCRGQQLYELVQQLKHFPGVTAKAVAFTHGEAGNPEAAFLFQESCRGAG